MSLPKLAALSSLAAIALSACGAVAVHPAAPVAGSRLVSRGQIDDPRTTKNNHVQCLRSHHLPVQEIGLTKLQIDTPPAGPRVVFTPSAGSAQGMQIQGATQGAEVIGSALLYPDQASDTELKDVETCLAQGVKG